MMSLQHAAIPQIHVNTAWQTGIETAHRSHDVDAFEFVGSVLFKNRRVLNGIFIRSWSTQRIARAGVPWRGRIRMVIGNFPIPNDDMMREHTAHCFMESAGNRFV